MLKELGYTNEEICKLRKEDVIHCPEEISKTICI
jgi:hypothetical protein